MDAQAAKAATLAERSFDPEACNSTSLRRASRAVSRYYDDHLARSGVTMAQFTLLAAVAENPSQPTNRLRKLLSLDRSNYSRSMKRLLDDDLVAPTVSNKDKRYRMVELTEKGRHSLHHANVLWRKAQSDFADFVGREAASDLRSATRSIEKLFDNNPRGQPFL